jgi:hypothetical protein
MEDTMGISRKSLEESKRISAQSASTLDEYNRQKAAAAEQKAKFLRESAEKAAGFSASSSYMKNKQRVSAMEGMINYTANAMKYGMTKVMTDLVERSLLLDKDEYTKINPTWRESVRDLTESLLTAGLSKDITNPKGLALMEFVSAQLPDPKTGRYLTEDALQQMIKLDSPSKLNTMMDEMSGDVKKKVAKMVVDEQKEAGKVRQGMQEISEAAKKAKGEPSDEEMMAVADSQESNDPEADAVPEAQVPPEEDPNAQADPSQDPNAAPDGAMPADQAADPNADPDMAPAPTGGKTTQINISREGDIQVNISEGLFRDGHSRGLIESMALNEGREMVAAGKPYSRDLALANAVAYATVLEAFDVSGLVDMDGQEARRIISSLR